MYNLKKLIAPVAAATMGFSTNVLAEGTAAAGNGHQGSMSSSMLMFGVMFVAIYFLMIRPQNKKAKQHRELIGGLSKGDEVVTSSGILGTIANVHEQFFTLSLGNGIEVPVQKNAIAQAIPKGTIKSI